MGEAELDLISMRRRLCYWSVLAAFILALTVLLVLQLLVYRFDAGLMALSAVNGLVMAALLLPGVFILTRRRFQLFEEFRLSGSFGRSDGEDGPATHAAARLERFPLFVAAMVLAAFSLFSVESGLLWFFSGRMLGFIALNYISTGLALGVSAAFLVFFFSHSSLKKLRRKHYRGMQDLSGVPHLTIASRIVAMAVVLTAVSIIMGWTTAEVNSVHAVQEQVLEKNRIHAKLLGDQFAGLLAAQVSQGALRGKASVEKLTESEYVELLDREGNPVEQFAMGALDSGNIDAELLSDARRRVKQDPTGNGSLTDSRGGLIAAYSPTGYFGMNLITVVPLNPFLGITWKLALTFLFLSLINTAICLSLAWITVGSFNQPMKELVSLSGEVGRGRLSLDIPVDSADEVGELSLAFRKMLESLREMIDSSKQTALLVMGEASDTYATAIGINESMGLVNHSIQHLSRKTRIGSEQLAKLKHRSEESIEANRRIADLIEEIRKDSERSLEYVEKGRVKMDGEAVAQQGHRDVLENLYAYLLKTAELSDDVSRLAQLAMEQNGIAMHALNEIHCLAEVTAVSAEELSDRVVEHSVSLHHFTASSQKLAELAILLQAQTAEFVTD